MRPIALVVNVWGHGGWGDFSFGGRPCGFLGVALIPKPQFTEFRACLLALI